MTNDYKKKNLKRITLADVASKAGVSAITVSRVVNDYEGITPVMREKVQSAIDELGYIPNRSASVLASSRSNVIGVLVPSLSNIVFNDVICGIYDVAEPAGYQILLADTHYSPLEEERSLRTLLSQSPEGMVITGGEQSELSRKMLAQSGAPIVQIMDRVEEPLDMNVGFSHEEAGYQVVTSLLERGYEKVAFIGARMDPRTRRRLDGYKRAMSERGLLDSKLIVTSLKSSSIAMGGDLLRDLMGRSGGDLDAIFCCNDDLALGVLFECQRMHIDVPGQIGICGFNDVETAAYVQPPLSSVHVGRYDMGAKAMEMILDDLRGAGPEDRTFDTGFEVRLRGSTK
ncbi:MAG: LacI family gluconate utilization system Gnt-I transcriptional repressor [Flavobacteriales bacterium]|jgi:LacI family gluconate utilization system Gnt-I transcriptional repressor